MFELTRTQMKTLKEIAARPDGRPEAYYTFSGARGKTINTLIRAGLIEKKLQAGTRDGSTMYRLVATDSGKQLAAANMEKGEERGNETTQG